MYLEAEKVRSQKTVLTHEIFLPFSGARHAADQQGSAFQNLPQEPGPQAGAGAPALGSGRSPPGQGAGRPAPTRKSWWARSPRRALAGAGCSTVTASTPRWHGARRALGRPLLGDGDPQRRRGPDPPAALPPEGKANPNNHRPNTGKWRNNSLPLSAWFTAGRQIAFYSSKCLMFYQNMQMVSRTEINCTSLRLNQMPC